LEARIKFAEAHTIEVAAAGEKHFCNFEKELLKHLAEMHVLYERNVQGIGGLCSLKPKGEPSVADYIRWLTGEVTGLSEVFVNVNKKIISAAVEGTLVMAGGSIDLVALQASTTDSGANILPTE
jgi:hypothetical protein